MTREEGAAVNAFVDAMREITVSIMADVREFPKVAGRGSGVLLPGGDSLVLLTAAHVLDAGKTWTMEAPIRASAGCFHVPLRELQRFARFDLKDGTAATVDFAWARVEQADFRTALKDPRVLDVTVEIPAYCGPLDTQPDADEVYGFASASRLSFDPSDRSLIREVACEVYMTLKERDVASGTVTFDLARPHQGDSYYKGASGAPIADSQGRIVALVGGGREEANTIWGIELARFRPLLDAVRRQS